MIDEDLQEVCLRKHSYLSQRESVDWLTVECAPENLFPLFNLYEI